MSPCAQFPAAFRIIRLLAVRSRASEILAHLVSVCPVFLHLSTLDGPRRRLMAARFGSANGKKLGCGRRLAHHKLMRSSLLP